MLATYGLASACEYCGLPLLEKHRTGNVTVTVRTDRSSYRAGSDPLLTVTLTNNGPKPIEVDAATPLWKQTSLHIAGPKGGLSYADVAAGAPARHRIAPGSSFTFPSPGKLRGTPLSRWAVGLRAPGTYHLDVTYDHVDGPTVAFSIT